MKKILTFIIIIIGAVALFVAYNFGLLTSEENVRTVKNPPQVNPFKEITIDFTHKQHAERLPFTGGAVIDVDGDDKMEIFISGSGDQASGVFTYKNGKIVDITEKTGLGIVEATYGATSLDMDNDGDTDLLVAQHSGAWIYTNNNGKFSGKKIDVLVPKDSGPLTIAAADLNKDGLPDLYISNFVAPHRFVPSTFNDPDHAKANIMLLNLGNGKFEDVTAETGTAGSQNTFHGSFVDLNNDGNQDLVLANNTGKIEIFKNNGDLDFKKDTFDSGLGYWMGLGIGDIDKDGDQDLYFSNIGSSIPAKLTRGDLRDDQKLELEWLLLRNDKHRGFTDVTKDYKIDGYGFAWAGVFEDINLDGELDLLVAQNYIKWPGHNVKKLPNKAFLQLEQKGKKGFYHLDKLGLNNPYYGQAPLIVDLNSDGRPDVVWINIDGPARAFLNQSDNGFFKVQVPDNTEYLGANITLVTTNGKSYTKQILNNVGLASDQTPNVFFGLGTGDKVKSLHIKKAGSKSRTIYNISNNTTIMLR